ncbi:MAG: NAD(P)/FAD-dependent oxidoreductase [Pseudomonadota bacterium]
MRHIETIIVGGGPAGATCARELQRRGREVAVIDKTTFPRQKLCAGWVTEKALQDLELTPETYPHPMLEMDIRSNVRGLPFTLSWFPTPGPNFSIRRYEFDAFLLERSGAEVIEHSVKSIRREGDLYVIDDQFTCRNLVGAGGTMCPVRRQVFDEERRKTKQIATLEVEFEYPSRRDDCRLYFFQRGLMGYAWFVPKGDGFVNIGIGGKSNYFRRSETNIHDHFKSFIEDLVKEGRIDAATAEGIKAKGHPYFLLSDDGAVKQDNCYLIGDSAGLASADLGEGIGPAVESGQMAAREIMGEGVYDKARVTAYSFSGAIKFVLETLAKRRRARRARRAEAAAAA